VTEEVTVLVAEHIEPLLDYRFMDTPSTLADKRLNFSEQISINSELRAED